MQTLQWDDTSAQKMLNNENQPRSRTLFPPVYKQMRLQKVWQVVRLFAYAIPHRLYTL